MDRGPFRGQRPADARPSDKPDTADSEGRPVGDTGSRKVGRVDAPHRRRGPGRFAWPIVVATIALIIAIGSFVWVRSQGESLAVDQSQYQAIFLTNGQVYFGKLQPLSDEYLKLTDVYYYLPTQSDTSDENTKNVLTKLGAGGEVHGPEDEMMISKQQVLFYENLKSDGSVSRQIQQLKGN